MAPLPPALDLESLPDLPPAAFPWLLAGVLLAWLALRVALLRGQVARHVPPAPPPPAPRWLQALARTRATLPLLLLAIGACAAVTVARWS